MIAITRTVLDSLQPTLAAAYLRAHRWTEHADGDARVSLWTLDTVAGPFEVLLPKTRELRDYALRLAQALQTLEVAEDRPMGAIVEDIVTSATDVIRIRVAPPDRLDGSIALNDGLILCESARNMLMAAACAALEPRVYYSPNKPERARDYLGQVGLGQTERGSFILTLRSPLNLASESVQPRLFSDEPDGFGRRVTTTLTAALQSLLDWAERRQPTRDSDGLDEVAKRGVSANLCEALVDINKSGRDTGLETDLVWSATDTRPDMPSTFVVPAGTIPAIQELGKRLKSLARPDYPVEGQVTELRRLDGVTGAGQVSVEATVDGVKRKVRVRLNGADYDRAAVAHMRRAVVSYVGEIVRTGRSYELQGARDVAAAT